MNPVRPKISELDSSYSSLSKFHPNPTRWEWSWVPLCPSSTSESGGSRGDAPTQETETSLHSDGIGIVLGIGIGIGIGSVFHVPRLSVSERQDHRRDITGAKIRDGVKGRDVGVTTSPIVETPTTRGWGSGP